MVARRKPKSQLKVNASLYKLPVEQLARSLLGKIFVRKLDGRRISGWIVEVEAYLNRDDEACHATRGQTKGNATMFAEAGTLYVYPIHAKYCMNVVAEKKGEGAAVLIRALEPLDGIEEMQQLRPAAKTARDLTSGPGKLCAALGIDRRLDGIDLRRSTEAWIEPGIDVPSHDLKIVAGPRIGISRAIELPLRFFIDGNRFVSGRVNDHSSGRGSDIGHVIPLSS